MSLLARPEAVWRLEARIGSPHDTPGTEMISLQVFFLFCLHTLVGSRPIYDCKSPPRNTGIQPPWRAILRPCPRPMNVQ